MTLVAPSLPTKVQRHMLWQNLTIALMGMTLLSLPLLVHVFDSKQMTPVAFLCLNVSGEMILLSFVWIVEMI